MAHEIGHAIGFDETDDRHRHAVGPLQDDVNGAQALYGTSAISKVFTIDPG